MEYAFVYYLFIGGVSVEITASSISISDQTLITMWSTDISDIFKIVVTATNIDSGHKTGVIVEPNIREVSIPIIDTRASYDVSVTIYDNCQRVITSVPFKVDDHIEPSSTILDSSTSSLSVSEETSFYSPPPNVVQTSINLRQTMDCFPCESCDDDDDGKLFSLSA